MVWVGDSIVRWSAVRSTVLAPPRMSIKGPWYDREPLQKAAVLCQLPRSWIEAPTTRYPEPNPLQPSLPNNWSAAKRNVKPSILADTSTPSIDASRQAVPVNPSLDDPNVEPWRTRLIGKKYVVPPSPHVACT